MYSLTASFQGNSAISVNIVDGCHFQGFGSLIVVSYCSIEFIIKMRFHPHFLKNT